VLERELSLMRIALITVLDLSAVAMTPGAEGEPDRGRLGARRRMRTHPSLHRERTETARGRVPERFGALPPHDQRLFLGRLREAGGSEAEILDSSRCASFLARPRSSTLSRARIDDSIRLRTENPTGRGRPA